MAAHERLALLAQPATPDVLDKSVEHMRRVVDRSLPNGAELAQFEAAVNTLLAPRTMTAMVEQGWRALRSQWRDQEVAALVDRVDPRVAGGACSGGKVSAATLAFDDGSYLVLVDHELATLTWLAAHLAAATTTVALGWLQAETTVRAMDAARALGLAVGRIATGQSAGPTVSLTLEPGTLRIAGALVREMDVFKLGHELAHMLLGHIADRRPVGAIGGSAKLLGKSPTTELAADLLAVTLMVDNTDESSIIPEDAAVGFNAVRLFLTVVERYEQQRFVVQPSSHPPATRRWEHVRRHALDTVVRCGRSAAPRVDVAPC